MVCWREVLLPSGILYWSSVYRDSEIVYRSSFIVTIIFMVITAAVLAEVCSALPLSGSIYIWAAESAGPKYARFFGFIVAWWSCTAWMTFTAGNSQVSVCTSLIYFVLFLFPYIRRLQTMSFHSLLYGKSTSPEGSPMIISDGVLSFGLFQKACSLSRWQSTTFLPDSIQLSSVFRSLSLCLTFSYA